MEGKQEFMLFFFVGLSSSVCLCELPGLDPRSHLLCWRDSDFVFGQETTVFFLLRQAVDIKTLRLSSLMTEILSQSAIKIVLLRNPEPARDPFTSGSTNPLFVSNSGAVRIKFHKPLSYLLKNNLQVKVHLQKYLWWI